MAALGRSLARQEEWFFTTASRTPSGWLQWGGARPDQPISSVTFSPETESVRVGVGGGWLLALGLCEEDPVRNCFLVLKPQEPALFETSVSPAASQQGRKPAWRLQARP